MSPDHPEILPADAANPLRYSRNVKKHPKQLIPWKQCSALIAAVCQTLLGCYTMDDVGETTLAVEGENALSYNRLSYNRLSYNRLSYNRLSYNSLDNDIHETDDGRELLRYTVRCALVEGDSLIVETDAGTFEYPGALGLAPEWEDGPLDYDGQQRISGCLIAHANFFGVSVPISVRLPGWLDTNDAELDAFSHYEGAFFGNLFAEEGAQIYSCVADSGPSLFAKSLDTHVGDRLLRLCTNMFWFDCDTIKSIGPCSWHCDSTVDGNYSACTAPRRGEDEFYGNPISVWLLEANDPSSVWPGHLELLTEYYKKQ